MTTRTEYRVSARVVLRPGDRFRARGGPYYVGDDGRKHAMGDRGPFTFHSLQSHRGRKWILATCPNGFCVLLLNGPRRSRLAECVVLRPYQVVGKVGTTRRQRSKGGAA
jgi:hypothetical protein